MEGKDKSKVRKYKTYKGLAGLPLTFKSARFSVELKEAHWIPVPPVPPSIRRFVKRNLKLRTGTM